MMVWKRASSLVCLRDLRVVELWVDLRDIQ
jgi:hypothetical protein